MITVLPIIMMLWWWVVEEARARGGNLKFCGQSCVGFFSNDQNTRRFGRISTYPYEDVQACRLAWRATKLVRFARASPWGIFLLQK